MKALLTLALTFGVSVAFGSSVFTYSDLVQLIEQKNITSIENLLPELPAAFRSGYTLMHTSRSLQQASFSSPRVIMFGQDAQLTCTFNGDASQAGFDTLECFQFSKESRSFDFRQIQFPTATNGINKVLFSQSNQSAKGNVSCSGCHGRDPRPNWDGYSNWQGAYGSSDDMINGEDVATYPAFVAQRSQHPRYQFLIQGPEANAPFITQFAVTERPNLRFSDYVGRANGYRAARILETRLSEWKTLAFAFSSLRCDLSSDQTQKLEKAGFNLKRDADLTNIFSELKISNTEWSTQIFGDTNNYSDYEHQSGFGYQSIDTAMAMMMKRADQGDQDFQSAFKYLETYVAKHYAGDKAYLDFFTGLAKVLPDTDFFGGAFPDNNSHFCPRLAELLTEAYISKK